MRTRLLSAPAFVEEALFGIGLSYGLTSDLKHIMDFRSSSKYDQLVEVSKKLAHMQGGHNKFLETITLALDITAPRYWWQEFDTYRVGVTKQSESTIHTIMARELTDDDFEGGTFAHFLEELNAIRKDYIATEDDEEKQAAFDDMKSALPEGYLQRRIVCLNLKTLQNIYNQRKNHRLPQWHMFFNDINADLEVTPYADLVRYYIFGHDKQTCQPPARS